MTLRTYFMTLMSVVSTVAVISLVSPLFIAFLVPIILIYMKEQAFFTVSFHSTEILRIPCRAACHSFLMIAWLYSLTRLPTEN